MYYILTGQFVMSHGSYDSNLGSETLILGGDIRSRTWLNISDSYRICSAANKPVKTIVQQSRQKALNVYCPKIYTVLKTLICTCANKTAVDRVLINWHRLLTSCSRTTGTRRLNLKFFAAQIQTPLLFIWELDINILFVSAMYLPLALLRT